MAPTSNPVHLSINGKNMVVHDTDQEASALLRLAGRNPATDDLFLVNENGVEEKILDDQIVNLKDDQAFVTRQLLRFTIDGETHRTYDDDQSAAALLRLAGVDPAGYDLARIVQAGGTETFQDQQIVKLTNGDEFVTAKHVGGVA